MHCLNHEHSQNDKTVRLKRSGSWKVKEWGENPKVLGSLYKDRKVRGREEFFPSYIGRDIVRRTISFCNRKLQFSCWRKLGGIFKCYAMDLLKRNYFIFNLLSINYEIVLTL